MVKKAILFFAVLMLIARFLFPGNAPFISDEPNYQFSVEKNMHDGTFPLTNFRGSSIALAYGAGGIYFYWPIRLLTSDPAVIIFYHIFFVSLSILFLYFVGRRVFGKDAAAWMVFSAASSPLLFLFSRCAWDNTILYPVAGALLYLFSQLGDPLNSLKKNYYLMGLIGLTIGFGINVHLMFGPLAVAGALTVVYFCFTLRENKVQKFYALLIFFFFCALLVAPYLYEALSLMKNENAVASSKFKERWGDARNLWWIFQRSVIFSSLWGSRIHFDGIYPELNQYVGSFLAYFFRVDLFGWLGKAAAWILPFVTIKSLLQKKKIPLVFILASAGFFSTLFTINYINIPTDPHYFNPIWWFVFLGIGWAVSQLRGLWKKIFLASLVLTVTVNCFFLFSTMKFVAENHGARNVNYGTAVREQERAMTSICMDMNAKNKNNANLDTGSVIIQNYPLEYHLKHLKACVGKSLSIANSTSNYDYKLAYSEVSTTDASWLVSDKNGEIIP